MPNKSSKLEIISKLVLGTAQLGMKYGIANKRGQPSKKESLKLLKTAWNEGIRYFDTAPDYKSELIIGEFVKSYGIHNEIQILTKLPLVRKENDWKSFIERSIENSLNNLTCHQIKVLFFHNAKDSLLLFENEDFFKNLLNDYSISSLGVSVYEPHEIERIRNCRFDLAFQFPFNLLDDRFDKNNVSKGKRYARSIFLQGFLASSDLAENAPGFLKDYHSLLIEDYKKNNLRLIQQAFKYVTESKSIDFFIFGVDSVSQLKQLFNLDLSISVNTTIIKNWRSAIPHEVIDPRKWHQ